MGGGSLAGALPLSTPNYRYVSQQGLPGAAVRALCAPGEKVSGGGGFSLDNGVGIVQNHPISELTGTIAFGTSAIGWQVATANFAAGATAFVICASG